MNCHTCTQRTLSLFIRSLGHNKAYTLPRTNPTQNLHASRFFSCARRVQSEQAQAEAPKPFATNRPRDTKKFDDAKKERPAWQVQKEVVKEKLGGAAWSPRKKLSPDTMDGIRHLHQTQPERFTTPVLAEHFKVSPEAIRRILKSRWRPSDEEAEDRLRRWDKRGEKIWSNLVELGIKPPKKWRDMGVGRASGGEKPRWKEGSRNTVFVQDTHSDEDIIPIVDGAEPKQPRWEDTPLSDRLGV